MATSFKTIRKHAQKWGNELTTVKETYRLTVEKYKSIYAGELLKRKIEEAKAEHDDFVHGNKVKLKDEIEETRKAKLEQLDKAVSTAPKPEQMSVLQTLGLRSNISESELKALASQMSNNYSALRVLRDIAEKSGYFLKVPDFERIRDNINDACDYAIKMLDEVENVNNYWRTAYYGDYNNGNSMYEQLTVGLDNDILLESPEIGKRTITEAEQSILDRLFGSTESWLLPEAVRSASKSPEMRKLIEMSNYSSFLEE